jgi:hypothetical protein
VPSPEDDIEADLAEIRSRMDELPPLSDDEDDEDPAEAFARPGALPPENQDMCPYCGQQDCAAHRAGG